ncbi:uncharacterized protein PV09_04236 [Verruconis gallopava]|uniref:MARVEL domain-containing protein n=1 Tax=Verruconis gallopava TaxID=253628 RepID=A0A0D1YV07_9PEZI|nr:uncharacterized protein PV09_04236 [Verruconis gallopava]KIW04477.1 hypothetical protein PV09_04236 [Verruconis gallopava]
MSTQIDNDLRSHNHTHHIKSPQSALSTYSKRSLPSSSSLILGDLSPIEMYEGQTQSLPWGMLGVWLKVTFRFLQFVLGLVIFGVYCADIVNAKENYASPSAAWILASTLGGLNAVSALLYLLPFFHSYLFFWWDWIIVTLHAGIIGVFGKAFIAHKTPEQNPKVFKTLGPDFARERSTAYVDCGSGILWTATAVMSTVIYLKVKRLKSTDGS